MEKVRRNDYYTLQNGHNYHGKIHDGITATAVYYKVYLISSPSIYEFLHTLDFVIVNQGLYAARN